MKSLYESILGSTKSGKNAVIRDIILNPKDKVKELNTLWDSFDLALDIGDGKGEWAQVGERANYRVPKNIQHNGWYQYTERKYLTIVSVGKGFAANIVIGVNADLENDDWKLIKKWADKIAKTFDMKSTHDKNHVYLNF